MQHKKANFLNLWNPPPLLGGNNYRGRGETVMIKQVNALTVEINFRGRADRVVFATEYDS